MTDDILNLDLFGSSGRPAAEPPVFSKAFPDFVDNSARSLFIKCNWKWIVECVMKLQGVGGNIHLHAGGAYAAGMEAMRKAYYNPASPEYLDQDAALAAGMVALIKFWGDYEPLIDTPKTKDRLLGALEFYTETWPLASDYIKPWRYANGEYAIEFTFAIPLEIKHPETGDPILYGGRVDMIGEDTHGVLLIEDDKTATQLGGQWSNQWTLDSAATGYIYAAQHYGYPVAGMLYRGVSILKTQYGKADALVYRSEWEIERWWEQLHLDVSAMIEAWEKFRDNRYVSHALDKSACGSYGGCSLIRSCASPDPLSWFATGWENRTWNPLMKGHE